MEKTNKNFCTFSFFLFLVFIFLKADINVFSQEEEESDALLKRYKWYYLQRSYTYDTIPRNAYKNATEQRDALKSTSSYL
jgi:TRAP-type uncharacterized transport system substrate-binding protein